MNKSLPPQTTTSDTTVRNINMAVAQELLQRCSTSSEVVVVVLVREGSDENSGSNGGGTILTYEVRDFFVKPPPFREMAHYVY